VYMFRLGTPQHYHTLTPALAHLNLTLSFPNTGSG
jgi:hypothetical protein